MPTLRQINVHPHTQERLSGLKRKRPAATAPPPASQSFSPAPATPSTFVAVGTPSALLSRDPTQLSTALGAPLDNIKDIRANVAEGIINIGHGGHAAEFFEGVTKCCVDNDNFGDDDTNNIGYDEGGREDTRPPPLMAGAVTALDLCAWALLLKNNSNIGGRHNLDCIRTGSNAIDQLLAPDNAYTSFDHGWSMPFPYKIPRYNADNTDSSSSGGVPFGMVTEFSGPPTSGKSQLALSIAAHAVFENKLQVRYISGGNSRKALSRRLYTMCLELARNNMTMQSHHDLGLGGGGITNQMREEEAKSVALRALDRVQVSSVPDAYSLLATLARIDKEEASRREKGADNGTLLIVDSVSGCLGHHLSGEKIGAALVSQVALTLRQMARTHDGHLGGGMTNHAQPRRFAVVVTNGSVAKRSLENDSSGQIKTTTGRPTQNKPAMGRYWHVSDVGVWLEEDRTSQTDGQLQPISNFYHDTPVAGLSMAEKKVISGTLLNHFGKSCKRGADQSAPGGVGNLFAQFRIRSCGIADV